jgi:hypothetical protein
MPDAFDREELRVNKCVFGRLELRLPLATVAAAVLTAVAASALATPALAFGDGARAYQLLPDGARAFSLQAITLEGNSSFDPASTLRGSNVTVNVLVPQFNQTFSIAGQQAAAILALPFGSVDGSITLNLPIVGERRFGDESSGIGDLMFGGVFGLVGSPSMTVEEYVAYKPGFSLGILALATAPTGEYSSDSLFNLGTNRGSLRLGVPFGYTFGSSYLDPGLATIEVLPSVTFFGDNDDPYGPADSVSTDPLYRLEAHVTKNVSRAVWLSLDTVVQSGAATTTDGASDDNEKYSWELGASVGVNLSKNASIKATYGQVIDRNENGMDGEGFRLVANYVF